MNRPTKQLTVDKQTFVLPLMSNWFNPAMLKNTALQAGLSSIFGEFADKRDTFSRSDFPEPADFSALKKEGVWIDYLADTGDGFNPTYTMAYLLRKDWKADSEIKDVSLDRGKILILGGDEVYPTASQEDYTNRLWTPYEYAYPYDMIRDEKEDRNTLPLVYAIPGNHDWYDGLNHFLKFFCQQRGLGGWQTQQKRSYFAIKLPHDWWIWGIDIQLGGDIDSMQLDYFQQLAFGHMNNGDKVILCTAEPSWVHTNTIEGKKRFDKLDFFINNYIKNCCRNGGAEKRKLDLRVTISGDLHHYARYQHDFEKNGEPMRTHRITAGGGGAFMHPTHNLDKEIPIIPDIEDPTKDRNLTLEKCFPDKATSKKMAWKNLLFSFYNYGFSLLLAGVLLVLLLLTQHTSLVRDMDNNIRYSLFNELGKGNPYEFFIALYALISSPVSFVFSFLLVAGILSFRDNVHGNKYLKIGLSSLHAAGHIALAICLLIFLVWGFSGCNFTHNDPILYVCISVAYLFLGGLMHGTIFGVYLLVANLYLKCHDNEAFSHFAIEDYKNMVKFHIDPKGNLNIYAIGVNKVSKNWVVPKSGPKTYGEPAVEPSNKSDIQYHLIEKIEVPLYSPYTDVKQ